MSPWLVYILISVCLFNVRGLAMNHMINLVYQTAEMSLVSVFIGECVNK